jgi:hypothetical protein
MDEAAKNIDSAPPARRRSLGQPESVFQKLNYFFI